MSERSTPEATVSGGVCRLSLSSGRWLATGWDGGFQHGGAAYNVSVPEGFDREDLTAYARDRLAAAGFDHDGPVLLTGVNVDHARGARHGPVTAVATVGLSNPASLPVDATDRTSEDAVRPDRPPGTVNLLVATTRALSDGTLATALGTAVEAKAATLQARTGFSGTTTDAVAVGCDPGGEPAQFAGSGTDLGAAIRVCVRDAVLASLDSRADPPPASVTEADHGVVTDGTADVFRPAESR
jgi:adenosylcobinamide hydrolase